MTEIANELNGSVTMADLANWTCLAKSVGTQISVVQKWAQNSFGPLGQNVPASRRIEGIRPHNRVVVNLDALIGYVTTPFLPADELKISMDGTVSANLKHTPYAGEQIFNEFTAFVNQTHTVNTLQINAQCDYQQPRTDQFFYIRKFLAWIVPCHSSCSICQPSNPNICSSCPAFADMNGDICKCQNTHFMHENVCIVSCPAGYTPDTVNRVCLKNTLNCATPLNVTHCDVCNTNYYLNTVDLQCYTGCQMSLEAFTSPKWVCQPYDKMLSQTEGFLAWSLFDRPWSSQSELGLKGTSVTVCPGCTQPLYKYFNWCGDEKIFGGYGRQTVATLARNVAVPAHYRYRFYVRLYLIDNWPAGGSVTITIGPDVYVYTSGDCAATQPLCGNTAYNDCLIIVDKINNHKGTPILVQIVSDVPQESTEQSFGFNNLYLAVEKCTPNCADCDFTTFNQCNRCNSGYYLHDVDKRCYKPCPNGFYGAVVSSLAVCLPCAIQCATCVTTATNCTLCAENRLGEPTCNCPDQYYSLNDTTALCTICSFRCTKCQTTDTNCTECAAKRDQTTKPTCSCQINTYEKPNQPACEDCFNVCNYCTGPTQPECIGCKSATRDPAKACDCADHYYGDFNSLHCQVCDAKCFQCSGTSTFCTSCPTGAAPANTLPRVYSPNTCTCPVGSYDNGTAYCPVCDYRCAQCTGPTSSPTDCQVCQPGRDQSKSCSCITGYDILNQAACSSCPVQCKTCDASGNCLECASLTTRIAIPQCLCKPGFYENNTAECLPCLSKCETCVNGTSCTKCKPDRDPPNCDCAYGKYSDSNSVCQPCHPNCASCTGEESFQCIQCSPNRIKPPYCECPQGTFGIVGNVICPKCHSSCLKCNGPNENQCIECDTTNRILQGQMCVCRKGFFKNIYGECQQCGAFCGECSDLQKCDVCKGNRQGQNCACPSGYLDTQLDQCPLCDKKCAECSITETNCTICATNRKGEPSCLCSAGFYEVSTTKRCENCQWQCQTCSTTSDKCTTCRGNRLPIQATNDCICPDFAYEDYISENCPSCHRSCKKCSGGLDSNCTLCRDTYERDSLNNCTCPSSTYEDLKDLQCKLCDKSCKRCAGPSNQECTECQQGYVSVKGFCTKSSSEAGVCSSYCTSCDSVYNCIGCKDAKRQLVNGKCLCLGGTYDSNSLCLNCNSSCLQCNGPQNNQCTSCRNGYILANGYCNPNVTESDSEDLQKGLIIGFSVIGGLLTIFILYKLLKYQMAKQAATSQYVYQDSRQIDDFSQIEQNNRSQRMDIMSPQNQRNQQFNQSNLNPSRIQPQQYSNDYMKFTYKQ